MLQNQLHNKFMNTFELLTNAVKIIDNDHSYIHQGKYFTKAVTFTLTTGTTIKFTVNTGTTKTIHWRPLSLTSSVDKLSSALYEGSSGNSGGTALTPSNRNRSSAITSSITFVQGATVTTNGTEISSIYVPGSTGVGGTRSGSNVNGTNEWVLKPGTVYTMTFTNGSSDSNIIFIEFQWYEE